MYEIYSSLIEWGYIISFCVGTIFLAILLLFAYLVSLVGGIASLWYKGWFKAGLAYGAALLIAMAYSIPNAYNLITADWIEIRFLFALIGFPVTLFLTVASALGILRILSRTKK